MNNEIKLYIYTIRKKILKLYIKMISFNYKNIISKDDANFFNIYDLSFIDDSYVNIIIRLIDVVNLINDIKNNQLGGERKQKHKYSNKENEEIKQLKQKIDELTKRIEMMQQQQMYLNNNNQQALYKAEMYQNALTQRHTDLTQCKANNQITLYNLETQQNELNKCKADREILTNDNSNLKEKILFFDKSLEILSKEIDTNLSNGILHLNKYENKIETKPRDNLTTVNIELSDKLSDTYNIAASSNKGHVRFQNSGYPIINLADLTDEQLAELELEEISDSSDDDAKSIISNATTATNATNATGASGASGATTAASSAPTVATTVASSAPTVATKIDYSKRRRYILRHKRKKRRVP